MRDAGTGGLKRSLDLSSSRHSFLIAVPEVSTRTQSRSRWLVSSRAELVVSRITATISIARQGPLVFSFAGGPTAWAEVEISKRRPIGAGWIAHRLKRSAP
jgi:hypothetical protein